MYSETCVHWTPMGNQMCSMYAGVQCTEVAGFWEALCMLSYSCCSLEIKIQTGPKVTFESQISFLSNWYLTQAEKTQAEKNIPHYNLVLFFSLGLSASLNWVKSYISWLGPQSKSNPSWEILASPDANKL